MNHGVPQEFNLSLSHVDRATRRKIWRKIEKHSMRADGVPLREMDHVGVCNRCSRGVIRIAPPAMSYLVFAFEGIEAICRPTICGASIFTDEHGRRVVACDGCGRVGLYS